MEKDLMNYTPHIHLSSNASVDDLNNFYNSYKEIYIEEVQSKIPGLNIIAKMRRKDLEVIEKRRLNSLIDEIKEKLNNIDYNKIDWNFFNSEEFARVVLKIYDNSCKDYREEKLKFYTNLIVNYTNKEFSKDFYKEGIVEKISRYTVEHIFVLLKAFEVCKENLQKYSKEENVVNVIARCSSIHLENIDEYIIGVCFNELVNDGLLYRDLNSPIYYRVTLLGYKAVKLINDQY